MIRPTQRPLPDNTQHSHNRHRYPWRDSNPKTQQASGRRPTPQTARPVGSADSWYQKPNVDHRRQAVGLNPDTVPSISILADISLQFISMFSLICSQIQVTVFQEGSPPKFVCLPYSTYHHNTVGSEDIIVSKELAGVVAWLGDISENEIEMHCYMHLACLVCGTSYRCIKSPIGR